MEHPRDARYVRVDGGVHVRIRAHRGACRRRWMGRLDAFWIDLLDSQRFVSGPDDAVARSATWAASDDNRGNGDRDEHGTARRVAGWRYRPGANDSCARSPIARRWPDARDAAWAQRGVRVRRGAILVEGASIVSRGACRLR